ncbi:MAG: cell wall metabolism sensor histidine kinase WalK, partial [Candidatus Obscuribacterales bacterium]|nr:cell wall metabolism sensor histidine kinase WalK [Candidatus Obscuribacterales bacterium]
LSEFLELEEFDQQAGSPGEELPGTTRETIATRSNGQKFPAEISISMIRTFEGKQAMILVVDITERHEIEAMKRRFVAMVSHELKTPLTSVQNYLELLDKGTYGTLNEKGEKTLKKVDDNLNRLTNLIEELLDIERLEQGSLKLSKSIIDLEDIFDLAMENIRAASKNKEIEIKMPETNLKLLADRDRLVQVLINLLVNAIKFSGKGTIIEVGLVEGVESLTISVSDQGRGIPREFIDKIFERYQQVNLEDSVRHGGAGLGLAICKEIITLHGGKIGCDSEAGKGSRFWFELPNLHV